MKMLSYNVTIEGFSLYGRYVLEEEEPATDTTPAYKPFCTVLSVFIKGLDKDVYAIIDPATIHAIEAQLNREAS